MPELPEVDLVARTLDTLLTGRVIAAAELRRQRLAPDITPRSFAARLKNARVNGVGRRGKNILIGLENARTLIVHLRMSGRFLFLPEDAADPKFAHAVFHLDDDEKLIFDDQRHFGMMKLVDTADLASTKELAKLGPEPASDELSAEYLAIQLAKSSKSIKEFLLDQTRVAGLGNIYAAEALFVAGIDPKITARKLRKKRIPVLVDAIRNVIAAAVEESKFGAIDRSNIDGRYGSPDSEWLVYGRENAACVNCNSPIVRLKQGGRSTFYCRKCQKR